jgi:RNA polymerase sigma-70 factor (ECF subfamily)
MRDEKLLELIRADANAGMERLIREYSGLVFTVCRARLERVCDSSEIEDCVSEVFLKFYAGLGAFKPKASIKTYLCVLARNLSLNCLRKRGGAVPLEGLSVELPAGSDAAEEAVKRRLFEQVLAEIERMGSPDSEILIRKYYLGYDSKTIARELGMTVSNVDTRAHRAMARLRKALGEENGNKH